MNAVPASPLDTPRPASVAVALVGAGPRGTSVLERLCASAPELLPPGVRLTVHVVDPAPPGPGRVWRTAQSRELLMNTVASQVTLFTDDSVDCAGPVRPGPSLHEWAAGTLGPDDYPTRADYGRYLEWVFARTVRQAPPEVRVETHAARAVRLDDAVDGRQTLTLDDGRILPGLAAVVLAQGHLPVVADAAQRRHAAHAGRHGLRHVPPANPADVDLSALGPGEPVLLRGLGLNFFDHTALLTTGRGGRFVPSGRGLRYLPSGREPRLYAGSRRGVPYQARGDNAKGPYGRHVPLVLTPEVISGFRKRADSGDAPDFLAEIWPLVAKEVETVYYTALLGDREFTERFLDVPHGDRREAAVLDASGVARADRWSWERISRPYAGREFTDPGRWREWLLAYLRQDAEEAARGNVRGPLKAALDVLRDLRNELRLVVDHGGLPGASRRDHLDRWYTPLNAFLSIGPPRRRIEELAALVEAGVVEVLGPGLEVREEDGAWRAHSPDVPGSDVRVTALVEARLPEPDLRRTADGLLSRLLRTGGCRPHTVDGYVTGGLDVTPRPYHLIDRHGRAHARRFAFGVPTEGVHWVTAAGARPGVDSVTLSDADAVARAVLRAAGTEPEPAGAEPEPAGAEPEPAGAEPEPAGAEGEPAGAQASGAVAGPAEAVAGPAEAVAGPAEAVAGPAADGRPWPNVELASID
ncbi:FAD/NAD(P)-binding protein [Streptomyces sp. NPDC003247]|uniref:FAD/NAD(P)-binding protein n=1 Tax=Streptomyces sp. NPDC003247 TaxID=3364677 RepID=UPI00367E562C